MLTRSTSPASRGISYRLCAYYIVAVFIVLLVDAHVWLFIGSACVAGAKTEAGLALPHGGSTLGKEVVDGLQARYDETHGFQADFSQEIMVVALKTTDISTGRVYFWKPGKMRWEFSNPSQLIVGDGRHVWFYQPTENQVIKTPFDRAFDSNAPASFLAGIGRLDEEFVVFLERETDAFYMLRLLPKEVRGSAGSLELKVAKSTYDIVEAKVTDALGNITKLQFSNITRQSREDERLFTFELPPGVDLLEPLRGLE